MAEPDPAVLEGASCTATLDEAAQTLTFDLDDDELPPPAPSGWRARLAKGAARAVVDGFFNTR
jgi:hypothetical protein